MQQEPCFICHTQAYRNYSQDTDLCTCPRCGKNRFSTTASRLLELSNWTDRQRANISGWLRDNQGLTITSEHVQMLTVLQTPSVADKAMKTLRAIESQSKVIGAEVEYLTEFFIGISSSINVVEVEYIVKEYLAKEKGYIRFANYTGFSIITPKGYAALEEARQSNQDSQIGFCAMWFSNRMNPLWTDAIAPAIFDAGYDAKRIDSHQHNNRIDDEIISMLRKSKFVVADFTGQRGGVYFEAGFALGLGLPVIWTVRSDKLKNVHFDNRQYNFVVWEPEKLGEFKTSLQLRVEATLGRGKLNNS